MADESIKSNDKWTTVIKPNSSLLKLNVREIWRYRDLIKMFIHRDFVTFYKQTILGPIWFVIQPLFTAGMFTFIFGTIANLSTDGIPQVLFYLAGTVNWAYFSECVLKTSNTFTSNANIFGKVYFPRLTVPISAVITSMIRYAIQFSLFAVVYVIFIARGMDIRPNMFALMTPLIVLYMAIVSLGFGIWVSSMTTKYRDLRFAFPFFVNLWMYASPVVYPLSLMPEKYKIFLAFNPMVTAIEFFRYAYFGEASLNPLHIAISASFALVVFLSGIIVFNKMERTFMDTV